MKNKVLMTTAISIIILLFSVSYTFAANGMDNAVNGVRNFIGGAENVIEDAGSAVAGTVRNGMDALDNDNNNNNNNDTNNNENTMMGTTDNNNNNGDDYTATRTATTRTADTTTDGITTNTWTWFIIGITAVGIGVLVWSYIAQNRKNNAYIDSNNNK